MRDRGRGEVGLLRDLSGESRETFVLVLVVVVLLVLGGYEEGVVRPAVGEGGRGKLLVLVGLFAVRFLLRPPGGQLVDGNVGVLGEVLCIRKKTFSFPTYFFKK